MEEVRNLSPENSFTGESLMRKSWGRQLSSSLPEVLIFQIARNSLSNYKTIFRIESFKDQNYLKTGEYVRDNTFSKGEKGHYKWW